MQTQTHYLITGVIAVVVGSAAFFGGMQYQLRQRPTMNGQFSNRMNGPMGPGGTGAQKVGSRVMNGMAPVNGEIISRDDTSITVKMPDGSSKIVLLSDLTTVHIATTGAKTDLKTGEEVTAFGTQNQDGSITAQSVAIGVAGMMKRVGGQDSGSAPTTK